MLVTGTMSIGGRIGREVAPTVHQGPQSTSIGVVMRDRDGGEIPSVCAIWLQVELVACPPLVGWFVG